MTKLTLLTPGQALIWIASDEILWQIALVHSIMTKYCESSGKFYCAILMVFYR